VEADRIIGRGRGGGDAGTPGSKLSAYGGRETQGPSPRDGDHGAITSLHRRARSCQSISERCNRHSSASQACAGEAIAESADPKHLRDSGTMETVVPLDVGAGRA